MCRPYEAGRFVFELVPPESLCLYLNSGVGRSYHHRTLVTVLPGQTASVVLTNSGWRLKGRFTLPEGREAKGFKQVVAYLNNRVPPVPTPEGLSGDAARLWLMDFENSAAGRQRTLNSHGLNIKPNADGGFETDESLPSGDYRLLVVVDSSVRLERPITLAAPAEGTPGFYDLGVIAIPAGTPGAGQ
ncbi:MAG TPA: hypothetical protein VNZ22_16430 [Bacillota bacterium]|nr:hypothetical protein [Bacillota bacterium]